VLLAAMTGHLLLSISRLNQQPGELHRAAMMLSEKLYNYVKTYNEKL